VRYSGGLDSLLFQYISSQLIISLLEMSDWRFDRSIDREIQREGEGKRERGREGESRRESE